MDLKQWCLVSVMHWFIFTMMSCFSKAMIASRRLGTPSALGRCSVLPRRRSHAYSRQLLAFPRHDIAHELLVAFPRHDIAHELLVAFPDTTSPTISSLSAAPVPGLLPHHASASPPNVARRTTKRLRAEECYCSALIFFYMQLHLHRARCWSF